MIAIFPAITACAATGDLERLTVLVRDYFGGEGKYSPNLAVENVFRNIGIPIARLAVDGVGALVAKDQAGKFEITAVLNPHAAAYDARFLLAHMLGHYFLHVQPFIARGDWLVSGFRETHCSMRRYSAGVADTSLSPFELKREVQADLFAAAFLMPKGMVQKAVGKLGDIAKVAALFGVSDVALHVRLEALSDGPNPQNFLAAENQMRQSPGATLIKESKSSPPPSKLSRGMERIREIARRLDKSSAKV